MGQADKTDTSSDQVSETKTEISEDVVDAEIVDSVDENTSADEVAQDTAADATDEGTSDDEADALQDSEVAEGEEDEVTEEASEETHAQDATVEPDEAPKMQDSAPASEPKKVGFTQVVLGGVIAAALGFGGGLYLTGGPNKYDQQLADLSDTIANQTSAIDALRDNQTAAQKAADDAQSALDASAQALQGVVSSVDAVNARIDDVSQALVQLDGRIAVIEKQPITQSLPSAAIEAYEREVEELKAAVASQREDAAAMEENARLTAQQALARAALTRIVSALDSGASFRVALTDYGSATGDTAPAALEAVADTGAPTLVVLQDSFPAVARAALAAARQSEAVEGNRLTSFLKTQLGARSVTPQEGADADAVLSRAEDALRAGQVDASLTELADLPDAAKAEMAAWQAEAEKRRDAIAAADAISEKLNAN